MGKLCKKIIIASFILFLLSPLRFVQAEGYQELYISVGDAMMKTKADDWKSVEVLVTQLNDDWKKVEQANSKQAAEVNEALKKLNDIVSKHDQVAMLEALTTVSHALIVFEKEQNPVDEQQQRKEVQTALMPVLQKLETAIKKKDAEEVNVQYKQLLSKWTRIEKIVREQSIPFYGKIETQTGLLRMALTQDEKDFDQLHSIYQELLGSVTAFVDGETLQVNKEKHSLQTLIDLLDKATQAIESKHPKQAVPHLQQFLTIWPAVEGEIQTRNGSLYTELESNIPIIAGKLSNKNVNIVEQQKKLNEYKQAIELLKEKTSYTMWDAALIMLREGLEALLIVTALIVFLRKANAAEQQKWIWLGAFIGVLLSIGAAILINMMFSAATAGANREMIEGITGIITVLMMIGVGIWLHQKSNMQAWNRYIQKQMGKAISTSSILSMAFISFLSIFREGAETIIFYMGMAPSISTEKLLSGIFVAVAILAVFAFVFIRYSTKVPLGPFFKVATFLIYFLAFKILGVSIHALQITDHVSTTQIQQLPIVNLIGFYPTWETIISQSILLLIIIGTMLWLKKTEQIVEPANELKM